MSDPIENCEDLCVAIIRSFGSWIRNNCTWIEDLCVAIIRYFGSWTSWYLDLATPTYRFACFSSAIAAFKAGLDGR